VEDCVQVKTYEKEGLVTRIYNAVKKANDDGLIIYGVDLTRDEYDALRKEVETDDELPFAPITQAPIYVDGKLVVEAITQRKLLSMLPLEHGTSN
jgi:hypothetical protein